MTSGFQNLLVGSISILIGFYANKYEEIDRSETFSEKPLDFQLPQIKAYDFIIVGAGSAGSVVANRLSNEFTVLLLEAGGDPVPPTYVPANYGFLIEDPSIMHLWNSVKQIHSTLDEDGIAKLGQGKFLGGSSVINGMSYNRGHPKDYDNWANITGDDSWNYANLLKYFKMSEDFHEEVNTDGHLGVGGPLTIQKGGKQLKNSFQALLNAAKELGYKRFGNSNAPQTEGFGPISETIRFGRRVSVYDAFLKPILDRNTLTVLRYSKVSKVNIGANNRAKGVYYSRHGIETYAKAKFEVILSAGSMNTPMILLRSGIGPKEQLERAEMPVKVDLPVGQQLQDHPWSAICAKFDDDTQFPLKSFDQGDVDKYLKMGTGPLAIPWGLAGQGFVVSSVAKSEGHPDWPDIEITMFHNSSLHIPGGDNNKLCLATILGRVKSRGSVSLDPENVSGPGIWDPRWLENERDVKVIAEGVKLTAAILETEVFKSMGVSLIRTANPACKDFEYGTDEYWQCYVRRFTRTTWHPVGTCKMGADSDSAAVVDTELKVRGVKGLRVIDNSIHPTIINANTNAPAIMIGQKGAQMILSGYERGEAKNVCNSDVHT